MRISSSKMAYPDKIEKFFESLMETITSDSSQYVEDIWNSFRNTIYRNKDRLEANIFTLEPVIKATRSSMIRFTRDPSHQSTSSEIYS